MILKLENWAAGLGCPNSGHDMAMNAASSKYPAALIV
jgi:hypothetical protein